jgi:hypothetical protein
MCASQYRNNILRINFHSSPSTVPYDPGEGKTKVEFNSEKFEISQEKKGHRRAGRFL